MGTVPGQSSNLTMKFFVVLALSALAMAEPEGNADAQLFNPTIYNGVLPTLHYPVVQKTVVEKKEGELAPLIYNTLPLKTPVVYNTAVKTPVVYNTALHTQPLLNAFPTLKTFTTPVVSKSVISKREAEADPTLLYTNSALHTPLVYNTHPLVSTGLHTPLLPKVYTTPVKTPLIKTVDNAVVPTLGGYIHSSHAGICTNNMGVVVSC